MPELPEVETIVRHLRPVLVGRMIRGVDLRWPRTLVTPTAEDFQEQLLGQQILALSRRAKYIVIHLARRYLLVHLRMSGDLFVRNQGQAPGLHDRLIVTLSEGVDLVFNDPRKFGRIWLVADPDTVFADLGPEPFSDVFTAAWLFAALHARRRQLKPLLLDQTFLAGLGNIYADEALHRARLHPLRWSNTVEEGEAALLWQAIRTVLQEGIRRNGASIDWVYRGGEFQNHFRVYGRTGQPCPVCQTPIERLVVGQRGTHICPNCQKKM